MNGRLIPEPEHGLFEAIPSTNLRSSLCSASRTNRQCANSPARVFQVEAPRAPDILSNTQVIAINGISSITAERCGAGTVSLSAAATSGNISWPYAADAGGTASATGPAYAPSLTQSAIYYVSSSVCPNALRVPVTATINPASTGGAVRRGTTTTPGNNRTTLTLAVIQELFPAGNPLRMALFQTLLILPAPAINSRSST